MRVIGVQLAIGTASKCFILTSGAERSAAECRRLLFVDYDFPDVGFGRLHQDQRRGQSVNDPHACVEDSRASQKHDSPLMRRNCNAPGGPRRLNLLSTVIHSKLVLPGGSQPTPSRISRSGASLTQMENGEYLRVTKS